MTGTLPAALVAKEARALAPVWLASAATILAAGVAAEWALPSNAQPSPAATALSASGMRLLAITAYLLGATALGALSVGHEYTHRTLGALLAQPIERQRLLLAKRLVLAGWLLALGALALGLLLWSGADAWRFATGERTGWWGVSLLTLPIVWALGIAPWLTLLFRNPIAGLVFTLAVPAACSAAASIVIFARAGMTPSAWEAGETLTLAMLWTGVAMAACVGVVAGGRLFARAEAFDGTGGGWTRSSGSAGSADVSGAGRVHRPIRLLLGKELRLQVWLAGVAGLYALMWAAVSLWRPEPDLVATILSPATGLYGFVVALFAGALASAEERGLGTLEWQTLLPYPAWRAWAVKVVTTFGLVLVVALGLPVLLTFVGPVAGEWRATPVLRMWWWGFGGGHWFFLSGAALVAVSLYVSSLCTSALRALLVSFPVAAVGGAVVGTLVVVTRGSLWRGLGVQAMLSDIWRTGGLAADQRQTMDMLVSLSDLTAVALVLGFIGALLWLACRNHHAAWSQAVVPRGQVAGLAIYLAIASLTAGAILPSLLMLWLRAG